MNSFRFYGPEIVSTQTRDPERFAFSVELFKDIISMFAT